MAIGKKIIPDFVKSTDSVKPSVVPEDEFKSAVDLGLDFVPAASTILVTGTSSVNNVKINKDH